MLHFLGPFYFHHYRGTPSLPFERIVGEVRAGRNGHDLWALGAWADPFEFHTKVALPNYALALHVTKLCQDLVASDPLPMVIANILLPNYLFKVLHVNATAQAAARVCIPGDSTLYQATVSAQWQLLAVAVAP